MEKKEQELLIRIDERVKSICGKIDTILEHNEKQNGWIKKHDTRITVIESKNSGKRELILLTLWLVAIVANVIAWVK